jgi:hypothetical protein
MALGTDDLDGNQLLFNYPSEAGSAKIAGAPRTLGTAAAQKAPRNWRIKEGGAETARSRTILRWTDRTLTLEC